MPIKLLRDIRITIHQDQLVDALLSVRMIFEMYRSDFANLEILELRGLNGGKYLSDECLHIVRSKVDEHMPDELKCKY